MNHLDEFILHLQEEGKGKRTVEEYAAAVRALEKWILGREEDFVPDNVTARDLHNWRGYMQTVERLAPATINKRIAAIKVYWAYLVERGYSTLDPTRKVPIKRLSALTQAPKWLPRKDQDKLLHEIAKAKNEWVRARNIAITQCMLQSGLRISEVTALEVQDVDLQRKTLRVISGKGGKNRLVFANIDLVRALQDWIDQRGEIESSSLFVSLRHKQRMSRQSIHQIIRKYLDRLGLDDYSTHSLRHSFCRNLIEAGQPIQVVAQLAGHENLETTRRYVTPSERDLRAATESISSSV